MKASGRALRIELRGCDIREYAAHRGQNQRCGVGRRKPVFRENSADSEFLHASGGPIWNFVEYFRFQLARFRKTQGDLRAKLEALEAEKASSISVLYLA